MTEQPSRPGKLPAWILRVTVLACFVYLVSRLPARTVSIGMLILFAVLGPVLYFRFCRQCWREFKQAVADAGGWRSKRLVRSSTCPMCGATLEKTMQQCLACGEKQPTDDALTWVPAGVLLAGIVLMIVIGTVLFAPGLLALYGQAR